MENAGDDCDDGFEGSDSSDDEEEAEEVLQQQPRLNAVYNSVAMHEKLEEIGWPGGVDWLQTLCIDYHVEEVDVDVNDDLTREMAFYTQALEGTREAFTKFVQLGKPFLRPPDYYAEMVKSDSHMLKVKDALLSQQKQMEEAEERRKAREAKRFSKEVQAQKMKQRVQEKKRNIESVKKWRKMRQDGGFRGGEDEFAVDFDEGNDDERVMKTRKLDSNSEGPSKKFKGSGDRAALTNSPRGKGRGPFGDSEKGKQSSRSPFTSVSKGSRSPAPWNRSGGKEDRAALSNSQSGKGRGPFGDSERGKQSSRSPFTRASKGSRSPAPWDRSSGKGDRAALNNSQSGNGRRLFRNSEKGKQSIRSPFKGSRSPAPWDRSGGKGGSNETAKTKGFQKRQVRNAKYGHGGRKGLEKSNTAESSAGFFKGNLKKRKS